MNKNKTLLKITLLFSSMMTMMAGAVVAPSLPQINNIFSQTPHADILTRLIITLPALFIAFFSPVFGKLSDTYGRKTILLISLVLYSFSGTSGYFLDNLYFILIGRAFLGISVAGIMTMVIALIGDYFKGAERSKFLGLQGAFMGMGGVIFIALAGWLADIGWHVPFLIYLFGFIVFPMALIYLFEPKQFNSANNPPNKITPINYSKKLVALIYSLIFWGIVVFYMIPVQIPYLLKSMGDITNSQIGLAISVQSLAGAIVAMNYKRIKNIFSFCSLYQLTFGILAFGYIFISFCNTYNQYLVGLLISGLGVGLLMPTGNMWIIEVAPESIRGQLVGKASTATFIAMFLSPIIIQPFIHFFSISVAFGVMGVMLIFVVIILYYLKLNAKFLINQKACK
ncbi:MAG: MFS transporter [Salinivirgaceae bacterium]|nr:MFS transporter [Salinivirgaceae bacterium]